MQPWPKEGGPGRAVPGMGLTRLAGHLGVMLCRGQGLTRHAVLVWFQALFVYNDWLEHNKAHPDASVTLYEATTEQAKATRTKVRPHRQGVLQYQ